MKKFVSLALRLASANFIAAAVSINGYAVFAQTILNPTVQIRPPAPLPNPSPTPPSNPPASMFNWHHLPNMTPNIVQDYFYNNGVSSTSQRTTWGVDAAGRTFSDYATARDVVINAHAEDLVLANVLPGFNIHFTTFRNPPSPLPSGYRQVDSVRLSIMESGYIGIGNDNPSTLLEIGRSDLPQPYGKALLQINAPPNGHYGVHFSSFGTFISNRDLGNIVDFNWDGQRGQFLRLSNQVGNDPGQTPSQDAITLNDYSGIAFETDAVQRMVILPDGFVGIGTPGRGTSSYAGEILLGVNGLIKAREIRVNILGWADDVFAPGYQLMPLAMLDSVISATGHLPGVPRSEVVLASGIELGETSAVLLRKIEELTLHLIDHERQIALLKKDNAALREGIVAARNLIDK